MVNQRNLTAVYGSRLKSQLFERGKLEKSQTDINRVGIERFQKLVRTEQGDLIVELWVDLMSSGQQLRKHHSRFRHRANAQYAAHAMLKRRHFQLQSLINRNDFNAHCEQPGGFYLGNAAAELRFNTPNHKANFCAAELPKTLFAQLGTQQAPFTLQTLRSQDQYNTTIYGLDDRYRGVYGQREVLFINPQDIAALRLADGDNVNIETLWNDGITRKVSGFRLVSYNIPRGNLAAYYPETNPLVPLSSVGYETFTPTSKSVPVVITRSQSDIQTERHIS